MNLMFRRAERERLKKELELVTAEVDALKDNLSEHKIKIASDRDQLCDLTRILESCREHCAKLRFGLGLNYFLERLRFSDGRSSFVKDFDSFFSISEDVHAFKFRKWKRGGGPFVWSKKFVDRDLIVYGDVHGHVHHADPLIDIIQFFLYQITKEESLSLSEILDKLNSEFIELVSKSMQFKKYWFQINIIEFDKDKTHFSYINFGLPIYIVRNDELIELVSIDSQLGFNKRISIDHEKQFALHKNDLIYLFTEGYANQEYGNHWSPDVLGLDKFKEIILEVSKYAVEEQSDLLMSKLKKLDSSQTDSILILCLKV